MPDVNADYGKLSDLNSFIRVLNYYYMYEALHPHQTFTNCVLDILII